MSFKTMLRSLYFGFNRSHCDDDDFNEVNNGSNRRQKCACNVHNHKNDTEWWNIGGPNTILPKFIESFLCWSLALSCLSISGYHYIMDNYVTQLQKIIPEFLSYPLRRLYFGRNTPDPMDGGCNNEPTSSSSSPLDTRRTEVQKLQPKKQHVQFPCWLPLMTYSRAELQRGTPYDRYLQLLQVLDSIDPTYIIRRITSVDDDYHCDNVLQCSISDDALIQLIRTNEIVRRLVSLALRPLPSKDDDYSNEKDVRQQPFGQQLIRIWSQLLQLPPVQVPIGCHHGILDEFSKTAGNKAVMIIALIIPCYHESTNDIIDKLKYALQHCHAPQRVQVRLVMAGKNARMDQQHLQSTLREFENDSGRRHNHTNNNHHQWGDIQIIEFLEESGRGPCLNYGATYASPAHDNILLYTFCHSDTRLPYHWDQTLIQTLYPPPMVADKNPPYNNDNITKPSRTNQKRINACAYRFGIDTSGLHKNYNHHPPNNNSNNNKYYPPGIHAIEVTANLRCTFWSLPYGDQCISVRKDDFHYLGGFPHQCLMEDYELITLLRKRMKLLPLFYNDCNENSNNRNNNHNAVVKEVIQILPGPPVLCSPRRWQKFGVFYVTYTNSRLVQLYNRQQHTPSPATPPEEIYRLYYGQSLDVQAPKSPWEIELERMLSNTR